jgi:two-component system, response regulator PdtaR
MDNFEKLIIKMEPDIYKELKGTTVLVVDDNLDFAETLKEQLEMIGMKVVGVANDGFQAIRLTEELDPTLVILDIQMEPGMDGIEVAMKINAIEPRPIIFLSAYSQPQYIERASLAGVFTYLVKPITIDKMVPSIVLTLDRFREMVSLKATVDDMKETLANRKLIEQAKGLLIEKKCMTESEAYSAIRAKSQKENKPMADIAQAIIMVESLL